MAWLEGLLRSDPQDASYMLTGWTIPALRTEASKAGYALSQHTLRRGLALEAAHVCAWSPRPRLRQKRGGDTSGTGGAGRRGTVWARDETTLRELPTLRSAWAKQGSKRW